MQTETWYELKIGILYVDASFKYYVFDMFL